MGNRFIRDLTINSADERRARQIKGIETAIETVPFRPWSKQYIGTETGAGTSTTAINSIGVVTIPATGQYYLSYSMDVGMGGATFAESFIVLGGSAATQAVSGTVNVGRVPHSGVWTGLLNAGTTVAPMILTTSPGLMIAYFTSFVVMRIA